MRYDSCLSMILAVNDTKELRLMFFEIKKRFVELLNAKAAKPDLKIMLIGSIYEVLEPIANNFLGDILACLKVLSIPMINYHALAPFNYFDNPAADFCKNFRPDTKSMTKSVLSFINSPSMVRNLGFGGYGTFNIGCAANAGRLGYDGVLHIYPFFCMPEIIAKPFLKEVCRKQDMPLLSIVTEENNADIGFRTKVEAFIDLIKWKKRKEK